MEGLDYYLEDIRSSIGGSSRWRSPSPPRAPSATSRSTSRRRTPTTRSSWTELAAAVDEAAADDAREGRDRPLRRREVLLRGRRHQGVHGQRHRREHGDDRARPRGAGADRAIPKVFIAQIEGHALGGGLEISLACDLRFGARGALQARRAGGDARAAARQRRHAAAAADHRRAAALDLMVTGRAGLAGRGARARHPQPPVRGERDGRERASTPSGWPTAPPLAIGEIKLATTRACERPLADGLARERERVEKLFGTPDASEGLTRVRREARPGVRRAHEHRPSPPRARRLHRRCASPIAGDDADDPQPGDRRARRPRDERAPRRRRAPSGRARCAGGWSRRGCRRARRDPARRRRRAARRASTS